MNPNINTRYAKTRKFPLKGIEVLTVVSTGFGLFGILSFFKGLPNWMLIVFPILGTLFTLIIWMQVRLWNNDKGRFTIGANFGGEDSYDIIRGTRKTILVTHFSQDVPSEIYQALLKEKLSQKVRLIRYVPKTINTEHEDFEWLKGFDSFKHYNQVTLDVEDFPMDILIIDDENVTLRFPVNKHHSEFLETISFKNPKVADLFNKILNRIKTI